MQLLLLFSVFVIATCGLIYELVAGTLASYLLGDSVTQFSTVIGVYLFSMGVGSWLSRFVKKNLLGWFVQIEILVGVVGSSTFGGAVEDFDIARQLWVQSVAAVATALFSGAASYFLLFLVKAILGNLRVGEQQEREGLDLSEHEELGYDW